MRNEPFQFGSLQRRSNYDPDREFARPRGNRSFDRLYRMMVAATFLLPD